MAGVPLERWLRLYEPVPEDNGVPNLQYIGQNRLRFPRYDKNWRAHIAGEGSEEGGVPIAEAALVQEEEAGEAGEAAGEAGADRSDEADGFGSWELSGWIERDSGTGEGER